MSPASAPHFSVAPVGRRARTPGAMARKKGKARPGGSASAPVPPGEDAPPPDAAATDRGDADPAGDGAVVSPAVPPSPAAVDVDAVALDLEPSDGEAADDEREFRRAVHALLRQRGEELRARAAEVVVVARE